MLSICGRCFICIVSYNGYSTIIIPILETRKLRLSKGNCYHTAKNEEWGLTLPSESKACRKNQCLQLVSARLCFDKI